MISSAECHITLPSYVGHNFEWIQIKPRHNALKILAEPLSWCSCFNSHRARVKNVAFISSYIVISRRLSGLPSTELIPQTPNCFVVFLFFGSGSSRPSCLSPHSSALFLQSTTRCWYCSSEFGCFIRSTVTTLSFSPFCSPFPSFCPNLVVYHTVWLHFDTVNFPLVVAVVV